MNNRTTSRAILSCLSYFNIFQHPLKIEEIANFLSLPIVLQDLKQPLEKLVASKTIHKIDDYYSLNNEKNWVVDRIAFEKRADEKVEEALHYGNLIRNFPFTKAVCISGSLSKHIMKEDSDIDFFIMAKANRIWISKLMLKLYKFFFLVNSRENFCINYFIAENNLLVKEQNRYTATELLTLIPLSCQKEYERLLEVNDWYRQFLPNFDYKLKRVFELKESNKPITSKIVEKFFFGKWGNFVDTTIMKYNSSRNNKKYAPLKKNKDFELMLRATKSQIKVHNSNHQNVTLARYDKLVNKLDNSY